jgi:hypothetical protein
MCLPPTKAGGSLAGKDSSTCSSILRFSLRAEDFASDLLSRLIIGLSGWTLGNEGRPAKVPGLGLVPEVRIELTTYPLPRGCATTTLLRRPEIPGCL